MEIDWNSCIILSSDSGIGNGYLALHDVRAQLPRGVDTIRSHLQNVDDVPLHVSLFAECTPPSITEMIRIFQEQGEVVCCIGSSLNDLNVPCFSLADISIAVDPLHMMRHKVPQLGPLSPLLAASGFNSVPCCLPLHLDTSLYSITQVIREARKLAYNGRQVFYFYPKAFSFYLGSQVAMSSLILISYCFLMPPIFTGYQIMFALWIIAPLISFSLLFTPHGSMIMTHMPVKSTDLLKDVKRFGYYFILRFCIVTTPVCIVLFIRYIIFNVCILSLLEGVNYQILVWTSVSENQISNAHLLFAQAYVLFVFIFYNSKL